MGVPHESVWTQISMYCVIVEKIQHTVVSLADFRVIWKSRHSFFTSPLSTIEPITSEAYLALCL
jgi:hypothetical protein